MRADTDAQKERVIGRLLAVWKANPTLRLGQLIVNAHPLPYYIEDEFLIARIEHFYAQLQARKQYFEERNGDNEVP